MSTSPLQSATLHSLKPIVEWLLPSAMRDPEDMYSVEDSGQGERGNSIALAYGAALYAPSHNGHKEIVQLLLEIGAM